MPEGLPAEGITAAAKAMMGTSARPLGSSEIILYCFAVQRKRQVGI
jgi:hypothetical protein